MSSSIVESIIVENLSRIADALEGLYECKKIELCHAYGKTYQKGKVNDGYPF